jgi:hypothetical protein
LLTLCLWLFLVSVNEWFKGLELCWGFGMDIVLFSDCPTLTWLKLNCNLGENFFDAAFASIDFFE